MLTSLDGPGAVGATLRASMNEPKFESDGLEVAAGDIQGCMAIIKAD